MKKTTPTRRVSVTLKPENATKLDAFIEDWNSRSFPFYTCCGKLTASEVVKFAVAHLLIDIEKAHHGLVHEGMNIEASIESFWREKICWEQNSERQDVEPGTHAEIINIMEAL